MSITSRPRLVVLLSGNGSNFASLVDAIARGSLVAQIVLVVSNRQAAYGLTRAQNAKIPTLDLPLKPYTNLGKSRLQYDADLASQIDAYRPDLIICVGWMHVLSPNFLNRFSGRVINLHPALPGTFPGTNAIQRQWDALNQGVIDTVGCMVHEVIPEVDAGRVIEIRELSSIPNETLEAFEARMHEVEHALIVSATKRAIGNLPRSYLPNETHIGVLGGGQLGRMLALAARRMGFRISLLDPDPNAPAQSLSEVRMVGSFRDSSMISNMARLNFTVLTTEIEHVNVDDLEAWEARGANIQPSSTTLGIIQDKFSQKQHFASHNIPVPPFMEFDSTRSLNDIGKAFGYPFVLKAKKLAYDGRGNAVIHTQADLGLALNKLKTTDLYAEKFIPFSKELAIMIARNPRGDIAVYPIVETFQQDNICHTVIAPAQISPRAAENAHQIAIQAVESLQGVGIFGVEMFLLGDDRVLLNEVAPRPHNSGHYTIEACTINQFEMHLRAILDMPLGDPRMIVPSAAMVNILGAPDGTLESTLYPVQSALAVPGTTLHWYAKTEVRAGRKMGHISITAPSMTELQERLSAFSPVQVQPAPLVGIIMGSDSDLPVMRAAAQILKDFGVPFEVTIVSAHRTPSRMMEYAETAHQRGLKVIIAGAGGAAHLPGMVAAVTPLPVIGVPIRVEPLDGQDALFSIVQMPRGIPVATVAIGNATNAALLAVRMLGGLDLTLQAKMVAYQSSLESTVLEKANRLESEGWEHYL